MSQRDLLRCPRGGGSLLQTQSQTIRGVEMISSQRRGRLLKRMGGGGGGTSVARCHRITFAQR